MISLQNISKKYLIGSHKEQIIFEGLNFSIVDEKLIAIKGRSGSGKTSFLKIIAGLDQQYQGDYYLENIKMNKNDVEMSKIRLESIGIVTQNYNLLMDRNVAANVSIALECQGKIEKKERSKKVNEILNLLGIMHLKNKMPKELSGGESQRVAIARALIKKPKIILADEPTGALDEETEEMILHVFKVLAAQGNTIIIVTHSDKVADICEKVYLIEDSQMIPMRS